jgi:hypothetical protein
VDVAGVGLASLVPGYAHWTLYYYHANVAGFYTMSDYSVWSLLLPDLHAVVELNLVLYAGPFADVPSHVSLNGLAASVASTALFVASQPHAKEETAAGSGYHAGVRYIAHSRHYMSLSSASHLAFSVV